MWLRPVISLTTSTNSRASALIWSGVMSVKAMDQFKRLKWIVLYGYMYQPVTIEFDLESLEAFLMNCTEFLLVCFSTTEDTEGPLTGALVTVDDALAAGASNRIQFEFGAILNHK